MASRALRTGLAFTLKGGSIVGCARPRIIQMGTTPAGIRRIVPIENAIVEGELIRGRVLPGGSDRQVERADGVLVMDAVWELETHDGVVLSVRNPMVRHADPETMARLLTEEVDPAKYYFRGWPRIEAPIGGAYDWVNRTVFVSSGIRTPTSVMIDFHRVP